MGAAAERPPRVRRPKLRDEPCAPAPERVWGWAVQLYALRSRESWGVGDFADLRHFARWSRRAGASAILLNPLGAQTPTLPYQPSPYYASTRRFRNILYLRVEEIEGADTVDLAALRDAARRLNDQRIIDYDEVFFRVLSEGEVSEEWGGMHTCAARAPRCATSPPSTALARCMDPPGAAGRETWDW